MARTDWDKARIQQRAREQAQCGHTTVAISVLISVIQARLTFQNSGPVNSNFPARLLR